MNNQLNGPGKILIVGGGTAGWMTAMLLAKAWPGTPSEICLLESSDIGIIGVGEGSTPKMRRFFDGLDIPESQWMPACNATYKCGIRFPQWSTRKGYKSYYHPFFSIHDDSTVRAFANSVAHRRANIDVLAHPDAFFVSNHLANDELAPKPDPEFEYQSEYAYHFEAGLIGRFLQERAIASGVTHLIDTVTAVKQHDNGDIARVETKDRGSIAADFFVDCTGFASVLTSKTLGVPFLSYKDTLFNDRAVALPTPLDGRSLPSQTISTALKYGWAWKIPLSNRFGNGYVYASDYIDADGAERELREHIGLNDDSVTARHLKMRVGRVESSWNGNCLAVGLSQGFIEPLEATALMIVQDTVENFITRFTEGHFTDKYRAEFNVKINLIFDSIKDYIFMHYKLNSRNDTNYWVDNRENTHVSDSLRQILDVWDSGGDMLGELRRQGPRLAYSPTSWFCILAGMGRFPRKPKKAKRNTQVSDPDELRRYCEKIVRHFPGHRDTIDAMRAAS
ncbi:MAG: tryptophan 7-halogenase [Proteobacteria bacterium]|nr:MAG: tryptophan 7-halogenase [Pseudomonadota bacterium]